VTSVAVLAAANTGSRPSAEPVESCTPAQKAKRQEALAAFTRRKEAQRRAFFLRNTSVAARRGFLKRQAAKLQTLKRAAGCRVLRAARADLAVTMSVSGTTNLTFTAVVRNRGPGRADRVNLTQTRPAGVEFVSANATAGRCSVRDFACSLGSLPSGAAIKVSLVFRRFRTGVIENTVSVDSTTPDPKPANNSATARSAGEALPAPSSGPSCSPNLTFPGPRAYFHLGPTNYDYYLSATGRLNTVVLFVDFPDAAQSDSAEARFAALVPPTAQWYSRASYGRFTYAAESVNAWLRMPKNGAAYELQYRGDYPGLVARHRAFLVDAVAVADARVDFSKYTSVTVVPAGSPGTTAFAGVPFAAGQGVVADGHELRGLVAISAPLAGVPDLVHETGHTLGLPELYEFGVPFAEGSRHLGRWEPMGSAGALSDHLGWVKRKLGWLDPSNLRCLMAPGVLEETISAIEASGGVKMIVLPTGATTAEVIEVHTLRGARNQVCDSGVIVYWVDVRAPSGTVGAHIRPARDDPTTSDCGAIPRAAYDLGPGEVPAYESAFMKVEVLASDGSSYRVRVTRK
jgi:M6 family metalloprotease-like protein/uncharacterized repeat protein (TIGR01451 family)